MAPEYTSKGMGAHATSQLTYDISAYSDVYTRFVAKMGVDAEQTATERSGSESLSQRTGQTGRNYIRVGWLLPPVMRSRWI